MKRSIIVNILSGRVGSITAVKCGNMLVNSKAVLWVLVRAFAKITHQKKEVGRSEYSEEKEW